MGRGRSRGEGSESSFSICVFVRGDRPAHPVIPDVHGHGPLHIQGKGMGVERKRAA